MLQPRDLIILNFIAKFGYCLEEQLCKLLDQSAISVKKIVIRLVDDGYLIKQKVVSNTGAYLSLTKSAAEFLEVKFIAKAVLNTLFHDTLLVDLYLHLKKSYPEDEYIIKTDKELRRELKIELNETTGSAEIYRVPDLLINDKIAIELELSEKPKVRLQAIINSYIINDEITEVNYYLQSKPLLIKIKTLTNNHSKFKFYLLEKDMESLELSATYFAQDIAVENTDTATRGLKKFGGYTFY